MPTVVDFLKKVDLSGKGSVKWVLTVCTGSEILARSGVLDGKRATTNNRAFNQVCPSAFHLFLQLSFLSILSFASMFGIEAY